MPDFAHLHVHTQYSLLDGAASIEGLVKKAKNDNMKAMAITDHGNIFGAFDFVNTAVKNDIKPIVGCEFYLVENRHIRKFVGGKRDKRYHQLMLAKNETGYKNLMNLSSLGFAEGSYRGYPRIDKELILKYHEGLIVTSCCIGAEIPQTILNKGEKEAEKKLRWWLDIFGEDYYIELQRHNLQSQNKVNEVLVRFAEKYNVKKICTNDSHYIEKEDSEIHDILLCINTGAKITEPKKFVEDDEAIGGAKKGRFGFPNDEFYFKTKDEMLEVFSDHPDSLDNTCEIADKVDIINLRKDIILPKFPIPENFASQYDYLEHECWKGLKKKYPVVTAETSNRLKFELKILKNMGFSGYFLIVSDFVKAAKGMGTIVGPGRGSAAGSLVAYCLDITKVDPVKYNLLFERFLNPERKSMPDIDIDFDDIGREKVIQYVTQKYGSDHVANIITFNRMGGKLSLRDVGRAMDIDLKEVDGLSKLISTKQGKSIPLAEMINGELEGKDGLLKTYEGYDNLKQHVEKIQSICKSKVNSPSKKALIVASQLEGSVRNFGVHAAGILVSPRKISDIIPIAVSKNSELLLSQFDGKYIEDAGILKIDILGIRNLTILKETLDAIEKNYPKNGRINLDTINIEDENTFNLFKRGQTNGIFQFESVGMQSHLKQLKPDRFEDIIALNALFRPGPIKYIPEYIKRKFGRSKIEYDLPELKDILEETYGITVYQEQVMLAAQKIAGFSKGDADVLRKAMGKKAKSELAKMKKQFLDGAKESGHDPEISQKIFKDWEAFASYAFNKSHSTCYAFVAYQAAYLKANYPVEFMASLLNNQKNISNTAKFLQECKDLNIKIYGPNVNNSFSKFHPNNKGEIYYGLTFLKNIGEKEIESIVEERERNGKYKDIFDFTRRLNEKKIKKSAYEALIKVGAFDEFGIHRKAYFMVQGNSQKNFIEQLLDYGKDYKKINAESAQLPLFGEAEEMFISPPQIPEVDEWEIIEKLNYEKETGGIYFTGSPLDKYPFAIKVLTNSKLEELKVIDLLNNNKFTTDTEEADNDEFERKSILENINLSQIQSKQYKFVSFITEAEHRISKSGKKFGQIVLEDFDTSHTFFLYNRQYDKYKYLIEKGNFIFIKGDIISINGGNRWLFNILKLSPLDEAMESEIKSIVFSLKMENLDKEKIITLKELLNWNKKGEKKNIKPLEIHLHDTKTNISVDLLSSKYSTVNLTEEFYNKANQDKNWHLHINIK